MAHTKTLIEKLERRESKAHLLDELNPRIPQETLTMRVPCTENLYNAYDPSPLQDRMLSSEAEDFLMERLSSAAKISRVALHVHVGSPAADADAIAQSITAHFARKAESQLSQIHASRKRWVRAFILSTLFLAATLIGAHILGTLADRYPFCAVLGESLGIIGWVALWEPAGYFLYGWQDDARKLTAYMRLHRATVTVTFPQETGA